MTGMGFFDMFQGRDINAGVREYKNTDGAVLLDVRTAEEYAEGHIPDAVNIPLDRLQISVSDVIPDKATPVFTYCLSGGRSSRAAELLKTAGYGNVKDIGGINSYTGKAVR